MNVYLVITLLQFIFIVIGFVITKVTAHYRKIRAITKTQALMGYGVSMLCLIGIPMLINVLSPFIERMAK